MAERSTSHACGPLQQLFSADDGPVGHDVWSHVQRGLIYPAPHALFATFWRATGDAAKPITKPVLAGVVKAVRDEIHSRYGDSHTTAVVGVGFPLWMQWCEQARDDPPVGMRFLDGSLGGQSMFFERSSGTFVDSQADLWFHIKSNEQTYCPAVFKYISAQLEREGCIDPSRTVCQVADTKSTRLDKLGVNIREDLPVEELVRAIVAFGDGVGSNLLTVTCANPETFAGACSDPEKYDLVRVRMGGWTEFFVAMFPDHQQQHRRRPISVADVHW